MHILEEAPLTSANAFCQLDRWETIDTGCAEPVRLRRPVVLRGEGLPADSRVWRWLARAALPGRPKSGEEGGPAA